MGKERKKVSLRSVFLRGCIVSLLVYLAGVLLLAFMAVKGMVPESGVFAVLCVLCVLAGACGSLPTVKSGFFSRLPAGILSGVLFACVLLITGACIWQGGFSWSGSGGALILCALGGGVLAACLGGRKRRAGKRIRK